MITKVNFITYAFASSALAACCIFGAAFIASAQTQAEAKATVRVNTSAGEQQSEPTLFQNMADRVGALRDKAAGVVPQNTGQEGSAEGSILERAMRIASTSIAVQANIQLRMEERRSAMEESRAQREQTRQERLAQIKARVSDRAYLAIKNIMERLARAYDKLDVLLATLDTKIDEAAAAGSDTSVAAGASVEAHASLTAAQDAISAAQIAIDAASGSDTPAQALPEVRTAIKAAADALRAAHQSIMSLVTDVRGGANVDVSASADVSTQ